MYTALSILLLCLEVGIIAVWILDYLVFRKRTLLDKKSLIYSIPVFLIIYAIYLMATFYNGTKIEFYTLFLLIHETLSMVGMELNIDIVAPLIEENLCFHIATIGACILSLATVIFSVLVLFGTRVFNAIKKRKIFIAGGDIVIGTSPSALAYLKAHKNALLWVEEMERSAYVDLMKEQYVVHKAPLNIKNVNKHLRGKEYHLIIFRDNRYSYSSILSCFETLKAGKDKRLFLHLEANVSEMGLIREKYLADISEDANTFVLPFCRYELIARQFVMEHPVTKYMPRSFFNENLTLKDDKEVNIVFLGFGKVNYDLFKLMVTNFQFAKQKDGRLYAAPVHYYTFEKDEGCLNNEYFIKLLNGHEEVCKNSDLPPVEKICDLKDALPMDAHSAKTRKQLRALVNENTYTYFIVSIGEDFQDAAFAHGLKKTLGEETNYKIFVRAKGEERRLLKEEENIIYFGGNAKCFSHENIVNDDLMQLSQNVNDLYNDYTKDKWAQLREWQKLSVIQQYSNINAAIHIYYKLGLMGVELKKDGGVGLTNAEFTALFPDAFMKDKGGDYGYFFDVQTANVLAFIEHSRWNAYYLLSDYKPLSFQEFTWVRNSKGKDVLQHKDEDRLRHACLTTYYGLDELIQYKYETMKKASEAGEKEVGEVSINNLSAIYRYDYMVIDGMYDALSRLGYSIIKREN